MSKKLSYAKLEQRLLEAEKTLSQYQCTDKTRLKSEDLFKTVFESANVGKSLTSPDGTVNVNKAFADMLGYTSSEMGTMTWQELTPADEVERIRTITAPIIKGEIDSVRFDKRYIHKNGSYIWANISISAHRDSEGKLLNFISTVIDITDRKQSEEKLKESNEKYLSLMDSLGNGVVLHAPDTSIILCNPKAIEILGISSEQMKGKKAIDPRWKFVRNDGTDMPLEEYPVNKALRLRKSFSEYIIGVNHPDREYITWANVNGSMVFNNNNSINYVTISFNDITEQRKTEVALNESNSLLTSIIESPEKIIMFALDREFNYLSFNNAHANEMKRIYDVDIEIGKQILAYMPIEADRIKAKKNYKRVLEGERFIEIQEYGQEETRFWYELIFNPIYNAFNQVSGFTVFVQDITVRKQAELEKLNFEKQILQTQKLESLGVLAGGIAHDFNNILMGILGYADLALLELDSISPACEFVQGIRDSSKKAAGLVNQMLAYSGKGKFSLEAIDLNHLIDDTVKMLEISISKKAVLKFNYSNIPVCLEGDPAQIRQIIMNLVINASDAVGEKSGVIAVSTGSMYCDLEYIQSTGFASQIAHTMEITEGMYAFVEVSDTGSGISNETISRIFEPFFTTKFTGRGLGLSAVLGIVRGHRGMVKIYSEEGRGTTFKVLFPAFEHTEITSFPNDLDALDQAWRGTGSFLIADDEESIRSIAKYMIVKLGFNVLTAKNGHEAIEIFKKQKDDIVGVLLDLTMPHKDGTEVFRKIRALNPQVKVILTSGYNEQDATQQFVGKGLAGFLQKPFVTNELVKKIKEVMS